LNIYQIKKLSLALSASEKLVILAETNLNVIAPKHVQVKDALAERLKLAVIATVTLRTHHAVIAK